MEENRYTDLTIRALEEDGTLVVTRNVHNMIMSALSRPLVEYCMRHPLPSAQIANAVIEFAYSLKVTLSQDDHKLLGELIDLATKFNIG